MSFNNQISTGYFHAAYGYLPATNAEQSDMVQVQNDVLNLQTTINNITENITVTDDNIDIGQPDSTTTIISDHFNVPRYIYMNSRNPYTETPNDSGLVLNIQPNPSLIYNVAGLGFNNLTVTVGTLTGLSAGQILAVQSDKNKGLFEIVSHADGIITISSNPSEPFLKNSFVTEQANGSVSAVTISVIRATSNQDTSEVAYGNQAPLTYNKMLYDTKNTGTLGKIILTDDSEQIESNNVKISIDTPSFPDILPRTLTVPLTSISQINDEFVLSDHSQALTNKTIMDSTNTVRATHLANVTSQLDISSYTAPTTGQMLTNGSWKTPFTVTAGSGLNGGTGGGTSNTNITLTLNRDLDDPNNDPEATTPDPPFDSGETPEFSPNISVNVPINIALALAGAFAAAGFAAGVGGFGAFTPGGELGSALMSDGLYTDKITDMDGGLGHIVVNTQEADFLHDVRVRENLYVNIILPLNSGDDITIGGPTAGDIIIGNTTDTTYIEGNLVVNGTTTSVSSNNVSLDSRYMFLNSSDSVNSAKSTGIVATRYPDSTVFTLTNWLEGDFLNNAQCDCSASTGLTPGDFVQVYSTDPVYTGTNKGYYEVLSLNAGTPNILRFRGTLNPTYKDFTKTNVETDAVTTTLRGVRVQISALEFGEDGLPYYIARQNAGTVPVTGELIAYNTSSPSFNATTSNTLFVDQISEKTASAKIKVNHDLDIVYKKLHVDQITSHSYGFSDPVNFPTAITVGEDDGTLSDIYIKRIYQRGSSGIQLQNNVSTLGDISIHPTAKLSTNQISERTTDAGIILTNNVILETVGNFDSDKLLCLNSSNVVKYRTPQSLEAELYTEATFAINIIGGSALTNSSVFIEQNIRTVNLSLGGFTLTLLEDVNILTSLVITGYLPYNPLRTSIFLQINDIWEECNLSYLTDGKLYIFRKDKSYFGAGALIQYGINQYSPGDYMNTTITFTKAP